MCGTDPTAPEMASPIDIREESKSYCGTMPQGNSFAQDVARVVRAMNVLAARLRAAPTPRLSVPEAWDPYTKFVLKSLGQSLARNTTLPQDWKGLAMRAQGAGAHFEDASRRFHHVAKATRSGKAVLPRAKS